MKTLMTIATAALFAGSAGVMAGSSSCEPSMDRNVSTGNGIGTNKELYRPSWPEASDTTTSDGETASVPADRKLYRNGAYPQVSEAGGGSESAGSGDPEMNKGLYRNGKFPIVNEDVTARVENGTTGGEEGWY